MTEIFILLAIVLVSLMTNYGISLLKTMEKETNLMDALITVRQLTIIVREIYDLLINDKFINQNQFNINEKVKEIESNLSYLNNIINNISPSAPNVKSALERVNNHYVIFISLINDNDIVLNELNEQTYILNDNLFDLNRIIEDLLQKSDQKKSA
ncbi:hypothetical protein [Vibrio olivae]|uniref:Uncharacterized protein n=1 Tax=Vibrio olivae TaxID=1243002 RepID=A0ABV5HR95_9VIBR